VKDFLCERKFSSEGEASEKVRRGIRLSRLVSRIGETPLQLLFSSSFSFSACKNRVWVDPLDEKNAVMSYRLERFPATFSHELDSPRGEMFDFANASLTIKYRSCCSTVRTSKERRLIARYRVLFVSVFRRFSFRSQAAIPSIRHAGCVTAASPRGELIDRPRAESLRRLIMKCGMQSK